LGMSLVGVREVLSAAWWVFAIYGVIVISMVILTRQRLAESHSFRCSLRYAALKVF
jgi:hypothetical protein